jgi:hypothetical protein
MVDADHAGRNGQASEDLDSLSPFREAADDRVEPAVSRLERVRPLMLSGLRRIEHALAA